MGPRQPPWPRGGLPTWLRSYAFARFAEVLSLAAATGRSTPPPWGRYREDLVRLDHQIGVARRFFGTATPPPVAVVVSPLLLRPLARTAPSWWSPSPPTGVAEGQRWLWRTYRGGVEDAILSVGRSPGPSPSPRSPAEHHPRPGRGVRRRGAGPGGGLLRGQPAAGGGVHPVGLSSGRCGPGSAPAPRCRRRSPPPPGPMRR